MAFIKEVRVVTEEVLHLVKGIVPKLSVRKHKGQYGRIGVIGGSLEYTGAPYFAAISALKVGSDLSSIFCQRDSATVIKSYSPELIVHPVLDSPDAIQLIEPWLERQHLIVMGPGLGRNPKIQKTALDIIKLCNRLNKPMIIDADGLVLLQNNLDIIKDNKHVILTPNAVEFERLFGDGPIDRSGEGNMKNLGKGVIVLRKGLEDNIFDMSASKMYILPSGGTGRRCGGQGDILCGSLATFYNWALESNVNDPEIIAIFGASFLVKQCNLHAFEKFGRSMLAGDMINEIHTVFDEYFECKKSETEYNRAES